MRDDTNWSVSVGEWADVHVRLHDALFVCAAFGWYLATQTDGGPTPGAAIVGLLVYLLSLAIHEYAHAAAAFKCGDRIERMMLGPVGGFVRPAPTSDPRFDVAIAAAGPAANLVLAFIAALTLALLRQPVGPMFVPFKPPLAAFEFGFVGLTAWIGWVNWVLFVVNLIPAYPLDGSQFVLALCRGRMNDSTARATAARIGAAAAIVTLIVAVVLRPLYDGGSLGVLLVGLAVLFCSRRELHRSLDSDDEEEDDDGLPTTSHDGRRLRADRIGLLRRWWRRRQEQRRQLVLQTEREEEARADEVLARLHSQGIQSISPAERALLERVSARYRRRQHQD